jgi:hypothetical protein
MNSTLIKATFYNFLNPVKPFKKVSTDEIVLAIFAARNGVDSSIPVMHNQGLLGIWIHSSSQEIG